MENPLDNLIGLYCIEAYIGYWEQFKLCCSKFPDSTEPEWLFETGLAAWRLLENGNVVTFEDKKERDNALKPLIGKKIVGIKKNSATDYSIIFPDNFQIDTFQQGIDAYSLELNNYEIPFYLSLDLQGNWNPIKESEGYTGKEKLANLHVEQTGKRWEKIVPRKSYDNHCTNCVYFVTLGGGYNFWKYGICSNKLSYYDGAVVSESSTCEYFDYELLSEDELNI